MLCYLRPGLALFFACLIWVSFSSSSKAILYATVTGGDASLFTYQWNLNGEPVRGIATATAANLVIDEALPALAGS